MPNKFPGRRQEAGRGPLPFIVGWSLDPSPLIAATPLRDRR
jgi:hypothetical protein